MASLLVTITSVTTEDVGQLIITLYCDMYNSSMYLHGRRPSKFVIFFPKGSSFVSSYKGAFLVNICTCFIPYRIPVQSVFQLKDLMMV